MLDEDFVSVDYMQDHELRMKVWEFELHTAKDEAEYAKEVIAVDGRLLHNAHMVIPKLDVVLDLRLELVEELEELIGMEYLVDLRYHNEGPRVVALHLQLFLDVELTDVDVLLQVADYGLDEPIVAGLQHPQKKGVESAGLLVETPDDDSLHVPNVAFLLEVS